jgi:hypothetical protein
MLSRVFMQRSQSDGFGLSRSDGPLCETTLADHEATICSHHPLAHGKPLLSHNVFQHLRGITQSATELRKEHFWIIKNTPHSAKRVESKPTPNTGKESP